MSRRRDRQSFAAILGHRTTPDGLPNVVSGFESDDGSAGLDIADAIAKEIDMTWAIIAVIEILIREGGRFSCELYYSLTWLSSWRLFSR
jgi:hypothetical protein